MRGCCAAQTPPRSFTKDGRVINMASASVQDLIDAAILFCGTPDEVYEQIADFCDYCGGIGNLLMMGQAGFLTHEETVDNLTLFAREVYPRLKAWKQPDAEQIGAQAVAAAEKAAAGRHRAGGRSRRRRDRGAVGLGRALFCHAPRRRSIQ